MSRQWNQRAAVGLRANDLARLEVLRQYAEFWKIPYNIGSKMEEGNIIVSSGWIPDIEHYQGKPIIISPASPQDAKRIAEDLNLQTTATETLIDLPITRNAHTSIRTSTYEFRGSKVETILQSNGIPVLSKILGTQIHLISVDIVTEFIRRLLVGLEDSPCMRFRLASMLPFSYRTLPRFVREHAFRSASGPSKITTEKLGQIEALRAIFLASLTLAASIPIPRIGFWRTGKTYGLSLTHDVESMTGLKAARRLLEVERNLQIRSSWSIVANRYPLSSKMLATLGSSGEICGHDTEHDGRLVSLSFPKKVDRLKECKKILELSGQTHVRGFRAPLLQHNRELVTAIGQAGYEFDSSVPSWEILSPTSLSPHGVGTVFPFRVDKVLEIPVSLPQDHQLLRMRGLTPSDASRTVLKLSKWIRELGGLCVLLVHPDYDYGAEQYRNEYATLLEGFANDDKCDIMTLGEVADWWASREDAYLDSSNGGLSIRSGRGEAELGDFEIQLLTGYDETDGFRKEVYS